MHLLTHNVAHNDLKEDNVMLGMDGNFKIIDFGLASITKQACLIDHDKFDNSFRPVDPLYMIHKMFKSILDQNPKLKQKIDSLKKLQGDDLIKAVRAILNNEEFWDNMASQETMKGFITKTQHEYSQELYNQL